MAVSFHKMKSVKRSKRPRCGPFCQQVAIFLEIRIATDFAASAGQLEAVSVPVHPSGYPRS